MRPGKSGKRVKVHQCFVTHTFTLSFRDQGGKVTCFKALVRTSLRLHSKKRAGFVWKTKDNCHEETRKLQIRKPQEKKYFFSNLVQEYLCKEPKGKRTRGQKYTLGKDRGRTAIYLRANNFVENCNQLL